MENSTSKLSIFMTGIIKENPILVMLIGMCPTLAITSSVNNALGMGGAVLFVLIFTNATISLIRKIVPNELRIPVYITVITSIVKVVELLMGAFMPDLSISLGVYLPLIAVNCIILGRAEAFASSNTVVRSIIDAIGNGIGFLIGLLLIASIRELGGTGKLVFSNPLAIGGSSFVINMFPKEYALSSLTTPLGAFLVFGFIVAIFTTIKLKKEKKKAKTLKI